MYWASKTEPKLYCTKMNGSSQTNTILVRHFAAAPDGYSAVTSAGVLGLSLDFHASGDLSVYWVAHVLDGEERWVWFGVGLRRVGKWL